MSCIINSLTGTLFNTPISFFTLPPSSNNTNAASTGYVQTAFPAGTGTGRMTLTGDQTLSGINEVNPSVTIPTINAIGTTLQVGKTNATDVVYLGKDNSTTLSVNGLVQSLINFFYFCVSSNATAGATVPSAVLVGQKIQAGRVTPTTGATNITFSNGTINTPFTNIPTILLTEKSNILGTIATPSNHWVTNATNAGFTANCVTFTNRTLEWVAIGT